MYNKNITLKIQKLKIIYKEKKKEVEDSQHIVVVVQPFEIFHTIPFQPH